MTSILPMGFNGPYTALSSGCIAWVVCGTKVNIINLFSFARLNYSGSWVYQEGVDLNEHKQEMFKLPSSMSIHPLSLNPYVVPGTSCSFIANSIFFCVKYNKRRNSLTWCIDAYNHSYLCVIPWQNILNLFWTFLLKHTLPNPKPMKM